MDGHCHGTKPSICGYSVEWPDIRIIICRVGSNNTNLTHRQCSCALGGEEEIVLNPLAHVYHKTPPYQYQSKHIHWASPTGKLHSLSFANTSLTHTHICIKECWFSPFSWTPLTYISLPVLRYLTSMYGIDYRAPDFELDPIRLQIYTHPQSFKYFIHQNKNIHISLIKAATSTSKHDIAWY